MQWEAALQLPPTIADFKTSGFRKSWDLVEREWNSQSSV